MRVARYIDRTNISEIFEQAVTPEPPLNEKSTAISAIYHGRKRAYKFLISPKQPRETRKFWDSLRDISDKFREYQNQSFVVEQMRREVEKAHLKSLELNNELQDLISKTAFLYVTLKNPSITASMIFKANQNQDARVQGEADEAYRL
jgi:adenylyl- and sulfurtransferase ThiI